jgi:multidrug resistance efflux pump
MKKIITILTLSTILFLSCGRDKKEATNNEPAIAVQVSGISADSNAPFVTASGKIEAENSANVSTRINNAKKDFERFQNLYKNQSASQKELDDMRARYEMAQAGLQAAQQMKNEVNGSVQIYQCYRSYFWYSYSEIC